MGAGTLLKYGKNIVISGISDKDIFKDTNSAILKSNYIDKKELGLFTYTLAYCYYKGIGVEKNIQTAIKYLEDAIQLKNPTAMLVLALMYWKGEDVEINTQKAIQLREEAYEEAIKREDLLAMFFLATIYEFGSIGEKNIPTAFELYKKTAEFELEDAYFPLGRFYYHGYHGKQDYKEAFTWLKKAPKNQDAYYMLGYMCYFGMSVAKDLDKARKYFERAGGRGEKAIRRYIDNPIGELFGRKR